MCTAGYGEGGVVNMKCVVLWWRVNCHWWDECGAWWDMTGRQADNCHPEYMS